MNHTPYLLSLLLLSTACGASSAKAPKTSATTDSSTPERLHLDAAKVSYQMTGKEDGYRKCFMRSIGSRGAVSLHFLVDEDGAVESSEVVWSTIGNPSVDECLLERISEQKFGERAQKSEGSWTFVFNLTEPLNDEQREDLLKEALDQNEDSFELLPGSVGTIDAQRVDEMVQVNYPLYAHCYRDSLSRQGQMRGLLRLRLEIDENGRLLSLEDAGSVLPDAYAVDCMAQAFYAIDYPKPQGGRVLVRYGLDFEL